jgi:hypothetical protein
MLLADNKKACGKICKFRFVKRVEAEVRATPTVKYACGQI